MRRWTAATASTRFFVRRITAFFSSPPRKRGSIRRSDIDGSAQHIRRRAVWTPAFAGVTRKTHCRGCVSTAGAALLLLLLLGACAETSTGVTGVAENRHELYYYPRITSEESYEARARVLPDSDRSRRLGYVAVMLQQQAEREYAPPFVLFAKGEDSERMIIVGLDDRFSTIYRARAYMAGLTALARQTQLFRDFEVTELFTFYDLARLMGFREIVLSDGRTWAHRVTLVGE
jgi:hypothetical protein